MSLPFHLLTKSERDCLHLVNQGYASKEISKLRSISTNRVEKIIMSARGKLGGLTRREAARRLVDHETEIGIARQTADRTILNTPPPDQKLGAQIPGLASSLFRASDDLSEMTVGKASARSADTDHRTSPASEIERFDFAFLAGPGGSARNALDRLPRLVAVFLIAAIGAVTAGAALTLLSALDHLSSL